MKWKILVAISAFVVATSYFWGSSVLFFGPDQFFKTVDGWRENLSTPAIMFLFAALGGIFLLSRLPSGMAVASGVERKGMSMYPTLQKRDIIWHRSLSKSKPGTMKRGDLILIRPNESSIGAVMRQSKITLILKRLIGLPGDRVRIEKGVGVFVNETLLDEPYVLYQCDYDMVRLGDIDAFALKEKLTPQFESRSDGGVVVPQDSVFVLGDNRPISLDSHIFGFVKLSEVVSKVVWIKRSRNYWSQGFGPRCNFCGKLDQEAVKIIATETERICDECAGMFQRAEPLSAPSGGAACSYCKQHCRQFVGAHEDHRICVDCVKIAASILRDSCASSFAPDRR